MPSILIQAHNYLWGTTLENIKIMLPCPCLSALRITLPALLLYVQNLTTSPKERSSLAPHAFYGPGVEPSGIDPSGTVPAVAYLCRDGLGTEQIRQQSNHLHKSHVIYIPPPNAHRADKPICSRSACKILSETKFLSCIH